MNCLTEALGLSLPAMARCLHPRRSQTAVPGSGHIIVDITRRYYEQDDERVLPRKVASFHAFENAMSLDIAMGGSTTPSCICSRPRMRLVSLPMDDIDRLSRRVPCLCKVARQGRRAYGRCPPGRWIMPSWRAGPSWSVECRRADRTQRHLARGTAALDICQTVVRVSSASIGRPGGRADPGGVQPGAALGELDLDRSAGVIRDADHAFSKDGGLAILKAIWPRTDAS